jgi:hypothetical protein
MLFLLVTKKLVLSLLRLCNRAKIVTVVLELQKMEPVQSTRLLERLARL